jgi:hypothetical protein
MRCVFALTWLATATPDACPAGQVCDTGAEDAGLLQINRHDPSQPEVEGSRPADRGSKLVIKNDCMEEPIWIASTFGLGDRFGFPNNFKLESGESFTFQFPRDKTVAATRFWPKMGCEPGGLNCRMGSSGGPGQDCPEGGCAPPVDSKFEATWWDHNTAEPVDWWDTSGVDGYTLPYTLTLDSNCPRGRSLDCSDLTMSECPTDEMLNGHPNDMRVRFMGDKEHVGCFSPCGKLTYTNWKNSPTWTPWAEEAKMYCCPTPPVSPLACRTGPVETSKYVNLFRRKCRGVYSYAYDDAIGLQTCPVGTTYTWSLKCPQ